MKKRRKSYATLSLLFAAAFAVWTAAVKCVDVQAIGPNGSSVGLAAINAAVHELTGVHMALYTVTDWLGLIPVGTGLCFALLGAAQLVRRKSLLKVDGSILALGVFYIAVLAAYLIFEEVVVNYRPVLIDGKLEASYPSSTTVLTLCVMPTAMLQLSGRVRDRVVRRAALTLIAVFTVLMVAGRLVSGVHWLSDIIGSILLSGGLVSLYAFAYYSFE